jgi:predicted ester cyclase
MTVVDSSRNTMESYLQALLTRGGFADYLSDDVALEIVGGQSAHGRAEVAGLIRYMHEQAFDGTAKLKSLVVEGRSAALEADFVGRHTAEFAGIPATGRLVRVPYSVHYDLTTGGQVSALRIYSLADGLVHALTA